MIRGLLSQKPDSPYPTPEVGQVRPFAVEERKSKAGKPWVKLKNDKEAQHYRIASVNEADPDNRGNLGWWIEVEGQEAPAGAPAAPQGNGTSPTPQTFSADPQQASIEAQVAAKVAGEIIGRGAAPVDQLDAITTAAFKAIQKAKGTGVGGSDRGSPSVGMPAADSSAIEPTPVAATSMAGHPPDESDLLDGDPGPDPDAPPF